MYAELLDLPTVPVLARGVYPRLQPIVEHLVAQPSRFGPECEGLVTRVASSFESDDFSTSVLKWVRAKHVKTDEHWIRNWKRAKLAWERPI